MDDVSVPVCVDDIKTVSGFEYTRCDYFTIECDAPSPGWTLSLGSQKIPFLMNALSGVIYRPSGAGALFTDPMEIERLFDTIEENGGLYVGHADIWLPNGLLEFVCAKRDFGISRGTVVRVGLAAFQAATAFRMDAIDADRFLSVLHEFQHTVTFSHEENEAFASWRKWQVEMAKERFPKNGNLALRWKPQNDNRATEGPRHE
jgi:hypothetical protein